MWGQILSWTIRIVFPSSCVGHGLLQLAVNGLLPPRMRPAAFSGYLTGTQACVPGIPHCIVMTGDDIILLIFQTLLYGTIALLGEYLVVNPSFSFGFADPKCPKNLRREDDERVRAEQLRVKGLDPAGQILLMDDVYKVYDGRVHAVRGISWATEGGQVFGLLGANGAGKSTTFQMLCGQTLPSYGRVFLKGMNVQNNLEKVRSLIGYCPQFSSLMDLLTVREHLELYGQVKGLSGAELTAEIAEKIETFDLTSFLETRAYQLSGGNARKLSTAIAVVNEPSIVLLDEPSAGMDPKARRSMWDVIQRIAQKRKESAVVLTTHSMDEADALCSRIAIQCSGQIRCIGTPHQLKEWYGTGLELSVRLQDPSSEMVDTLKNTWGDEVIVGDQRARVLVLKYAAGRNFAEAPIKSDEDSILTRALAEWCLIQDRVLAVDNFLNQHCGESAVTRVETSGGTIRYILVGDCLGGGPLPYGKLFELIGAHRSSLSLVDFEVSQGTLEKTFNRLAKEDIERSDADALMQASSP